MSFSINTVTSDGVETQFPVSFVNGIYSRNHVFVYVEDDVDGGGSQLPRSFTWINDGIIQLDVAAPTGKRITIQRKMNRDGNDVDYQDGGVLDEQNLDQANNQLINLIQEIIDTGTSSTPITDLDMLGFDILNAGTVNTGTLAANLLVLGGVNLTSDDLLHVPTYSFNNIYEALASTDLTADIVISTGLSTFSVTTTVTNLPVTGGTLYLLAKGDIWADDFINPANTDDGVGLRIMRDHAEALGRRVTLRSSGVEYRLQSTEVVPAYGGNVGLYITDVSSIRINFGGSKIYFDSTLPALGDVEKDAVLAIAPQDVVSATYAFGNMQNFEVHGGNDWVDSTKRPKHGIKADYKILGYCLFEDIMITFCKEDGWVSDGFVMLMRKIRSRFCGTSHAGFKLVTTLSAKTGYLMDGCTVDYAGMYGIKVTGPSGHTYCHLNNCHVDFVGRNDDGSIIEANITTAHAYSISDVRVFNFTACGAEYCTSVMELHNTRSVSVNGLFALGAGHTDGVTEIDHLIKVTDYFEQVNISNVENRSPKAGGFTDWLVLHNVAAFNWNTVQIDNSIKLNRIRYDGGTQTSHGYPLLMTPAQLYKGNNRKGPGAAVKSGNPEIGADATAWYNFDDVLEQTFYSYVGTTPETVDILDLWQRTGGSISFFIDIKVCRATDLAPSSYTGAVTFHEAAQSIVAPVPTLIGASGTAPTIVFAGSTLSVVCPNAYAGYYIKVTAVQRSSTDYQRFNWL